METGSERLRPTAAVTAINPPGQDEGTIRRPGGGSARRPVRSRGRGIVRATAAIPTVTSTWSSPPGDFRSTHWLAVDAQGDLFFDAGGSVDVAGGRLDHRLGRRRAPPRPRSPPRRAPPSPASTVTFTAAVTPQAGAAVPTGSIQFEVDGTDVGNPVPLGSTAHRESLRSTRSASAVARRHGGLFERLGRLHRQHGERLDHGRGRDGVEHPVRRQ